jgi:hypothetical protein
LPHRLRSSRRTLAALALAVAAGAALASSGACTSDTTTLPYTPITGIIIRAQNLVSGVGCGTGDGQVYRYVATLTYALSSAQSDACAGYALTNVFDCFADGAFENLPNGCGTATYQIDIYAYTAAGYASTNLPGNIGCTAGAVNGQCGLIPAQLSASQKAAATWTSQCVGTQMSGSPVEASCTVLAMTSAGNDASAGDASGDGGDGANGSSDATGDGPTPDGEAADASPADAADAADASTQGATDADSGSPVDSSAESSVDGGDGGG